jgi:hypothetical protein
VRADSGATRRRQSEKRRGRGRHRVGLGVPARVCQDEYSGATVFRVAKAEAPHDDPPAKGAPGSGRVTDSWTRKSGILDHESPIGRSLRPLGPIPRCSIRPSAQKRAKSLKKHRLTRAHPARKLPKLARLLLVTRARPLVARERPSITHGFPSVRARPGGGA